MNKQFELVKFEQDDLILDVNVSPSEDTVWLSKEDISILFGRDRSVITKHINKIYKEGELDRESTCAKNAHVRLEGARTITRTMEFYNLDVIISVGYRVKSQNGIIFRRWANSVLKEYLLKGYVLNQDRALITNDNYIELVHRVNCIDNRLSKLESDDPIDNENIFFNGQWFDARSFIKELFMTAKEEIILIDSYADIKALDYLKVKADGVKARLFVSSKAKLTQDDIAAFNEQYGNLIIEIDDSFHDRFILLDKAIIYHLGASLNCIGKKVFAITKLEDAAILDTMKNKLGF